jgi:hypothetical protein
MSDLLSHGVVLTTTVTVDHNAITTTKSWFVCAQVTKLYIIHLERLSNFIWTMMCNFYCYIAATNLNTKKGKIILLISVRVTRAWLGPSFKWKFNLWADEWCIIMGMSYRLSIPATHRCSCLQIGWIWAMFNKCSWCSKNVHDVQKMFTQMWMFILGIQCSLWQPDVQNAQKNSMSAGLNKMFSLTYCSNQSSEKPYVVVLLGIAQKWFWLLTNAHHDSGQILVLTLSFRAFSVQLTLKTVGFQTV